MGHKLCNGMKLRRIDFLMRLRRHNMKKNRIELITSSICLSIDNSRDLNNKIGSDEQ